MKEEFLKNITDYGHPEKNRRFLLAVSGGIDSMVMVHLFLETGFNIGIAHCNFNLRGEESDGDEKFVQQFAAEHEVPFHVARFDTSGYADEKGISVQMAARELRYRWFEETREQNGYDMVALAHNLNDNVETFLINLSRGTGIAGLTGMRFIHNNLIRPLLFATRSAIEAYSSRNSISYREDRTNADTKYTRNKIRHKVLPVFREINPSFDSTITETAERLGEISELVNSLINPLKDRIFIKEGENIVIRIKELPYGYSKTLLFELFKPLGIQSRQLKNLEKLISGKTGNILRTEGWRLVKNRNELIATPMETRNEVFLEIESLDKLKELSIIDSAAYQALTPEYIIPSSPLTACLDADRIEWPLLIRNHLPGDFFYPLGMKARKKLSDYFIDRKFSLPEKEKMLVLQSGGKIIWLMGERIDNRFRISPSTKNTLVITLKQQ